MEHCEKCFGQIYGDPVLTAVGLLCGLCFVGALRTGELPPIKEEVTVH